jgi:glutathione S-transferase
MSKLFCAQASPFSAKVRMACRVIGHVIETVCVDTAAEPLELLEANPLGKIPTLVVPGLGSVYDSTVILRFLDRKYPGKIYPQPEMMRLQCETREALCDGIAEALLLIVYERRFRGAELRSQDWTDRQWRKVKRGLDTISADLPAFDGPPDVGHFALRAVLGYLKFRFAGVHSETPSVELSAWSRKFDQSFPDLVELVPPARTQ